MQIVTVRGREGEGGMLKGRGVRDHQGCHLTRGSVVPGGGNKHADHALVRTARIMLG